MAALPARCHSNMPTTPAGTEYIRKNCRSWSAFVIPMHESTKQQDRSQPCSLLPRNDHAINRTRSARSVRSSVQNWRAFLTCSPARLAADWATHLAAHSALEVASKFSQREYRDSPLRIPSPPLPFCRSADTPPDYQHCSLAVHRQDSEFVPTPAR